MGVWAGPALYCSLCVGSVLCKCCLEPDKDFLGVWADQVLTVSM